MITTLSGNNSFLISQKLNELVGKFVSKYSDLAVEKIDGEEAEIERINESLLNLPFLIEKKLVVLRDPSKNKQFSEKIEQIISSIPDSTEAIIVESKLDKRQTYYKALKDKTNFSEFTDTQINLGSWLVQEAKNQGGQMSVADARYLTDRVGNSQQLLFQELQKLLIYDPTITKQSIDLLTEPNPESSVFDLLDAAFNAQNNKTLVLYEQQRRQKVEPLNILSMIGWQLHILALIKTAKERTQGQIAKEAGLNPYVVSKSYTLAKRMSYGDLKKLVNKALKLDIKLKTKNIDADEALKQFLLSLSS